MSFNLVQAADSVRVEGDLTIYTSAAAKDQLFGAVRDRAGSLAIDLSGVTEMDTAGLQILLLAQRVSIACGTRLRIENPSPIVRDVLMTCGLMRLIDPCNSVRSST